MAISNLPSTERQLTGQEALFVAEYVASGNAHQSYRQAYSVNGISQRTLDNRCRALLKRPHVARAVEAGRVVIGEKLMFDIKDVMLEWMDIATADPNELISVRARCCRFCYGVGHAYQWTDREYHDKCFEVMEHNRQVGDDSPKAKALPTAPGGLGFNFTLDPAPHCPECRGEGEITTVLHDSTKLSRKAAKLYAGVKQTKFGIEVLMRDQDAALANIAKALGMFVEVVRLEHHMTQKLNQPMPSDPVAASLAYQELLNSDK